MRIVDTAEGAALAILIRPAKTYRRKLGVARMLRANSTDLCHLRDIQLLRRFHSQSHDEGRLFPASFRSRLVQTLK